MTNFQVIADRFQEFAAPPDSPPDGSPWTSPYRLLAGAAYSIGCFTALPGHDEAGFDWLDLRRAIEAQSWWRINNTWGDRWQSSYLLTNAIFRVAASVEKMCYLTHNHGAIRGEIRRALRERHPLSERAPSLRSFLGPWPTHTRPQARDAFLRNARQGDRPGRRIPHPLLCCIMQTDQDKHVPYAPIKSLEFDFKIATEGFMEACQVWEELHGKQSAP
jgi:hypothetical protein